MFFELPAKFLWTLIKILLAGLAKLHSTCQWELFERFFFGIYAVDAARIGKSQRKHLHNEGMIFFS